MNEAQFRKKYKQVDQIADRNGAPNDHWVYQQLAQANLAFEEGRVRDAKKWLDKALVSAQQYGTSPRDIRAKDLLKEVRELKRLVAKKNNSFFS